MGDWMDDIEKYRRGELTPKEMHDLEKRALSDPFLADALEGLNFVNVDELSTDLDQLRGAVHRKKTVYFTPVRIAAGIVLLIAAGVFMFWPSNKSTQLVNQTTPSSDSIPDTTTEKISRQQNQQLTLADESGKEQKEEVKTAPSEETQKSAVKQRAARQKSEPSIAPASRQWADSIASDPKEDVTRQARVAPLLPKESTTPTSRTITGTVTVAEDGLPLPGVTIKVKDLPVGTTTDINGYYSLEVPDSSSLVFSFVGMQTSEITTADKSKIDVKMNEDVAQLSEVVITRSALARTPSTEPVVILAEPLGGIKAYDKYMEDNLVYPQQALDNNVKGRVVVEFEVGIDGALNNFVVMRSLGYGCDDEVIRLVKEGPTWRPTTEDNKPVESSVRVRMKFDPSRAKKKR